MSDQVPTRQRPGPAAVRALGLWSALLLVSGHAAGADVTTDHDAPEALTLARALLVDEGLRQLCIHPASPTPDAASRAASGWRDRNASRVREAADRLARAYPFSPADDDADRAQAARRGRSPDHRRIRPPACRPVSRRTWRRPALRGVYRAGRARGIRCDAHRRTGLSARTLCVLAHDQHRRLQRLFVVEARIDLALVGTLEVDLGQ